tara:strand:+ start:230 stop:1312 length:1083 start_codon:yes stop_codon:yes gene_type:complete
MEQVQIERVYTIDKKQMNQVKAFLLKHDLSMELPVTSLFVAKKDGRIIGTGGIEGNIIKMLSIEESYRGTNLIGRLLTTLMHEGFQMGQDHLFIYTKPESVETFVHLGFYLISKTDHVALLENKKNGIIEHLQPLVESRGKCYTDHQTEYLNKPQSIGAVVVNCNPFTYGHQHLIETASSSVDLLYIFVLSEDRSTFPFDTRYRLVKEGTDHLKNVIVYPSGPYMVSRATFPTYFLGDDKDQIMTQTELDAQIFAESVAHTLGIKTRFLGKEPYNPVTEKYNAALENVLSKHGIHVEIIERKSHLGKAISASNVRAYIAAGDLEKVKPLVPQSTWKYLMSDEAAQIIRKIESEGHLHKRV